MATARMATAAPPQPPAIIAGRYADLAGCDAAFSVAYAEGSAFDRVSFGGADSARGPLARNSVLLVPGLLSAAECARLVVTGWGRRFETCWRVTFAHFYYPQYSISGAKPAPDQTSRLKTGLLLTTSWAQKPLLTALDRLVCS